MPEVIVRLGPTVQIGAQVPDGPVADGKATIEALFAAFSQQMPLTNVSDVEAHCPEGATEVEQHEIHRHPPLQAGQRHGH